MQRTICKVPLANVLGRCYLVLDNQQRLAEGDSVFEEVLRG